MSKTAHENLPLVIRTFLLSRICHSRDAQRRATEKVMDHKWGMKEADTNRRSRTWTQPSSRLWPQAKILCPRATGTGEGSDREKKKGGQGDEAEPGRNPAPACDLKRKFFVQGPQAPAREAIAKRRKERAGGRSRTWTQPSSGLRPQAKIFVQGPQALAREAIGKRRKERAGGRSRTWTQPSSGLRPQAKFFCPRATGTGEGSGREKKKGEGKETKQNLDATQLRPATSSENSLSKGHRHWRGKR